MQEKNYCVHMEERYTGFCVRIGWLKTWNFKWQ